MNKSYGWNMRKISTAFLVVFSVLLFSSSVTTANHHHKGDFLHSVRAEIERTHRQLSPLTRQCFSLADTNKLLQGVDRYVIGVAVDQDYLAHFKLKGYVSSFIWGQHPESGLTQPRYEDAGWGDIAFTPQERRYSGWIILAQPPNVQGDVTAFHEAIHAYHLGIKSDADADKHGAPESITNNFSNVLTSLQQVDNQLNMVLMAKRAGQPYLALENDLFRMIDARERIFKGFANQKFFEVLANIGGKADWTCYRERVREIIKNTGGRKAVRLEIRATHPQFSYRNSMTLLKGQSTIFKAYLLYSDSSEEEVTNLATWGPDDFFNGGRGTFHANREGWVVPVKAEYKGLQDLARIEVIDPRLKVSITASPPGLCGGEETDITYSIEVENPGIAMLTNVWVLDSLCSDLYVAGSKATFPTFMGYYSSETFQCTKKISRETTSEVIVTGEYEIDRPGGNTVRGTVEAKDKIVIRDGSVSVPFVTGWNIGTAVREIRDTGLDIGRIRIKKSDTVAPGNVISQSPIGGTEACLGDKVDLVRSWGLPTKRDDEAGGQGDDGELRAVLDCGDGFELEPGDYAGKSCGVVVTGWAYNDVPVEVSVDYDAGSGISIFPEQDRQHPMNMYNPGITDYGDRYIFSLSFRAERDAPAGLSDFIITVKQPGTGEVVLPLAILVLDEGQVASKGPGIRPPAEVITGSGGEFCVWRHKSFGDRPECFNFSRARCDNQRYADPKYELVGSAMTWREAGVRMAQLGSYHEDAYGCHTTGEETRDDDDDIDLPDGDDDSIESLDRNELEATLQKAAALRDSLNRAQAKFMAAEKICSDAKQLRQEMTRQVAQVEKAEAKIDGTLRAADELVAQCPDVDNPDNIRTLYMKAEELTVQIGVEVPHIIKNRDTIADKTALSDQARSQALSDAVLTRSGIEALYAAHQQKTNYSSVWIGILEPLLAMRTKAEHLIATMEQQITCDIAPVDDLVSRADNAYAGAVTNLGAHEGLPGKAEDCTATVEAYERKHDEALAAIASCDLEGAKSLIDAMAENDKKKSIQKKYDAAKKLEAELKVMVNQEAKAKYKTCDYEKALEILQKALSKAKCDTHKTKINKSITAAKKGQQLEAELKVMVNQEAKAKYKVCDYDGALKNLNKALSLAKCETHRTKISKSIAAARKGQKQEAELKVLVNEKAKNKFRNCDYDGAVQLLNAALSKAKCQTHKDKIRKSLAATRKRQDKENRISAGVQEALRRYSNGQVTESRNSLNNLLNETRCDANRSKINNAIAKINVSERNNRDRRGDCSHCAQFDNWLITNSRACGYHGARLPSICSADPECVSWNNRCNEVRRKKQECYSRCQGGSTYNPYGN